jgi:dipeptidase D
MSEEIKILEPKLLWKNFYEITQIPRPSKKESKAALFIKEFGEKLRLETIQDEVGNVVIRKPATPGFENRKTIILQSHIDMVPQANSNLTFNFDTDPIDAYIDGEWVTARDPIFIMAHLKYLLPLMKKLV